MTSGGAWYKNRVSRFVLGLLVGAVVGAGGTYAALERPWGASAAAVSTPDAGPTPEPVAKKRPGKRKKRRAARSADDGPPVLTDADRKLVWKGDAVALPARSVDMGSGAEARSLSPNEINDVLRSSSAAIQECIADAAGEAELKSSITLELLVTGDGLVTKVRMRAPAYLFDHGFQPCARRAAKNLRFPSTGAPTVVTAPFDLY